MNTNAAIFLYSDPSNGNAVVTRAPTPSGTLPGDASPIDHRVTPRAPGPVRLIPLFDRLERSCSCFSLMLTLPITVHPMLVTKGGDAAWMPCRTQQNTTLTLLPTDCPILQCRDILTTPFLLQVPAAAERYHAALLCCPPCCLFLFLTVGCSASISNRALGTSFTIDDECLVVFHRQLTVYL